MKSTASNKESALSYPCLKAARAVKGLVVLFTKMNTGTVVANSDGYDPIGKHSDGWHEDNFSPYFGTVTLEN